MYKGRKKEDLEPGEASHLCAPQSLEEFKRHFAA